MSSDDKAGVILKTALAALLGLFLAGIGSIILGTLVFAHTTNPNNQVSAAAQEALEKTAK